MSSTCLFFDNKMDSEDYMSHIRNKNYLETEDNRLRKRSLQFNSRRNNYEKIASQINVPSIEEFKKHCKFFSQCKKLMDLQRIRLGLTGGGQYITLFLGTEGALYALIGCLTGINTKLQLEALYCIINIGLGTEEECLKVCQRAGTYLVTCIGGGNYQTQDLCLWAFGNLMGKNQKVCMVAKFQGFEICVPTLVSSPSPNVVQSACYALNHYLNTVPERMKDVCTPEMMKLLIEGWSNEKSAISDIPAVLFSISTEPNLCTYLINYGVVSSSLAILLDFVKNKSIDVPIATALIRLLTNCIAVLNGLAIELCYQADQLILIINFLLKFQHPHLSKEVVQFIANVINAASLHPVTGVNILEDSNLKSRLEPALRHCLASHFVPGEPNINFTSNLT